MSNPPFLLDTNVLSEPLRPRPDPRVLRLMRRHANRLVTSAVVWHELAYGASRLAPSRARELIERYLRDVVGPAIEVLPYDRAAAAWHAEERGRLERTGRPPSFADGQIAATAAVNGLVLVTRNVRDFAPFRGLVVRNWFGRPDAP